MFIVAYLLLDAPGMAARLRAAFGHTSSVPTRAAATADRLRTYLVARTGPLGAVAAVLDTILLVILGVPDALLWGMLSFLLSFIPNIGFIVALIPPTIVGLLVGGPLTALLVVVGYSVINVAIDYVVQPRYVGSEVNLSSGRRDRVAPVLGGHPWRVRALLAVPLTIVAMAIFDAFDDSRPLATMLGSRVGDEQDAGMGPGLRTTRRCALTSLRIAYFGPKTTWMAPAASRNRTVPLPSSTLAGVCKALRNAASWSISGCSARLLG